MSFLARTIEAFSSYRAGPLYGFRSWKVHPEGTLYSLTNKGAWEFGVNEAKCSRDSHVLISAPHSSCSCGFYAYKNYDAWLRVGRHHGAIHGIVASWGKVIYASDGFRAQYMKPLILFTDRNDRYIDAIANGAPMDVVRYASALKLKAQLQYLTDEGVFPQSLWR